MERLGPQSYPEIVDWGPDVGAEIIDDEYTRSSTRRPPVGRRPGIEQ
jgi:antitoxin MazE